MTPRHNRRCMHRMRHNNTGNNKIYNQKYGNIYEIKPTSANTTERLAGIVVITDLLLFYL